MGVPSFGRVLAHRRDHRPVLEHQLPQPERSEERRRGAGSSETVTRRLPRRLAREPAVHPRHEFRVADLEVVVGDAQRAGEQVEGELDRRQVHVALGVLEPLEAHLRGALQALHRRDAARPRRRRGRPGRSPWPRARGTSTIASSIASFVPEPTEKCAVCAESPTSTTFSWCQRSLRTVPKLRQMERFCCSRCPASSSANSSSQNAIVSCSVGAVEARRAPRLLPRLDDERRMPALVLVGMDPPQAVAVGLEVEGEGGEGARRAEPHEPVGPPVDGGAERVGEPLAHQAVRAVGGEHQVGLEVGRRVGHFGAELDAHAQVGRPPRQDLEHRPPRESRKAMAGGARARSPL